CGDGTNHALAVCEPSVSKGSRTRMHWLRGVIGVIGLWASGCVIGFDAGSLTKGGGAQPGAPTVDLGGSGNIADPSLGDIGKSTACVDFSAYADGTSLPNWV